MGGSNNFFNQLGTKIGVATGLMDDPSAKVDKALKAQGDAARAQIANVALGKAPAVSEMQYGQALQQSAAMQQALANSARGVNPALAQRAASQNIADAQAQAAAQSAIMEEEERRKAQQILLGQYNAADERQFQSKQAGSKALMGTITGIGKAAVGGGF